jgi:hypothetical protein
MVIPILIGKVKVNNSVCSDVNFRNCGHDKPESGPDSGENLGSGSIDRESGSTIQHYPVRHTK